MNNYRFSLREIQGAMLRELRLIQVPPRNTIIGLGKAAGVSPALVCAYENQKAYPTAASLAKLLRALGKPARKPEDIRKYAPYAYEFEIAANRARNRKRRRRAVVGAARARVRA
jgi:transcriptional regulator with XRE-family HTH domain